MKVRLGRLFASLGQGLWTLQRFGLTPAKLIPRVTNRSEPRILCVSLPKAGTHLLERALCLHPRLYRRLVSTISIANLARWGGLEALLGRLRPGQIIVSHLGYRPEFVRAARAVGVYTIFLVRDPRDLVLSHAYHVAADTTHELHALYTRASTLDDRLRMSIQGHPAMGFPSIGDRLGSFVGWLNEADLVVRFEDLIGAAGGGSAEHQLAVLRRLYGLPGLRQEDAPIRRAAHAVFSSRSPTFRRGQVGRWREELTPELRRLCDEVVGDRLCAYGYEP